MYFIALSVVAQVLLHGIQTADAVMCYKCDHVAHPRDCDRVVECGQGEKCHAVTYAQPDGNFYYTVDCLAETACPHHRPAAGRRDIAFCNFCCDGHYCNKELCDLPATPPHGPRCLRCDAVEHPSHCGAVTECGAGQSCYTKEKSVFQERRYELGCATFSGCTSASARDLFRRQSGTCLECCTGENCNRNLCSHSGSFTVAPATQATNSPFTVPHHQFDMHGCHYKGRVYQTGQKWDDGCIFHCMCINATTGHYECHDVCPTYTDIPAHCRLETSPGECCAHPVCSGIDIHLGNITSFPSQNKCYYQGRTYTQDQSWRSGCEYDCTCTDATRGVYRCRSLCYTWHLPSECHLNPPVPGKCCQTPNCPAGFTVHYPPGYVEN